MSVRLRPLGATVASLAAMLLSGCASQSISWGGLGGSAEPPPAQPAATLLPASIPAADLVGRWGLAAYHKDEDRPRIEAAAAQQCANPYLISMGPTGGVMMHLADQATPTELRLKGAPGGKTYIGPAEDPPASMQDREVVHFDGRILILRWMDSEVQGRYGTMVYVRCAPEGAKRPRPKGKPKAKPAAKPAAAKPAAAKPPAPPKPKAPGPA